MTHKQKLVAIVEIVGSACTCENLFVTNGRKCISGVMQAAPMWKGDVEHRAHGELLDGYWELVMILMGPIAVTCKLELSTSVL